MFYTLIKQVLDQSERAQGPIYIINIGTQGVQELFFCDLKAILQYSVDS